MRARSMKLFLTHPIWVLLTISSCSYSSKACKKLLDIAGKEPYDLIVIPGSPYENGWTRTMKARIYWSKFLYDQKITKNIMYSGSSVYTPYTEGIIMALYGEAIGIPREHIYVETKAEHSTENIYYSYKKAKKLNFIRIALASDPFQTKLLHSFTRKKINEEIGMIPIVFDTLKSMESSMIDPVIPQQQAFVQDFVPISQRQSIYKRLKGTLGLNIDKNAY